MYGSGAGRCGSGSSRPTSSAGAADGRRTRRRRGRRRTVSAGNIGESCAEDFELGFFLPSLYLWTALDVLYVGMCADRYVDEFRMGWDGMGVWMNEFPSFYCKKCSDLRIWRTFLICTYRIYTIDGNICYLITGWWPS